MALSWFQVDDSQKAQYLNFVLYDFAGIEALRNLHIPFEWIFHDKDIDLDPTEGERKEKKAHYHVLIDYGNTTTIRYWKKLLAGIPANDYAELTASPRGYHRYMCHEDDPSKHQYSADERHQECGFSEYELLSKTDTAYLIRWINHWIISNDITEYDDLVMELDDNGLFAESATVIRNTIHFTNFLKSRRIKAIAKAKKEHDDCMEKVSKKDCKDNS